MPLLVAFGFIADLYRPAASAIIGDLLPSSERASGFAGLRMAVNLGWASGTAIGGLLADWDWRLLFLGDGLTTLAYGVLVYFTIPETRPEGLVPPPAPPAAVAAGRSALTPVRGRGPTNPLRDGVFMATTFTGLLFTLIFCSHLSILPLTVTQSAGYPAVVFGLLAAVNGVLVAFFEISITARLKPFRRLRSPPSASSSRRWASA